MFRLAEQIYSAISPNSLIQKNAHEMVNGFIGSQFGNSLVSIGALANTVAQLMAELTGSPTAPPVLSLVIVVPPGDYRLKIAGTVVGTIFWIHHLETFLVVD